MGQRYIVTWTLWVRDTLGHGQCGSEIHWVIDTVSQRYIGTWTVWVRNTLGSSDLIYHVVWLTVGAPL